MFESRARVAKSESGTDGARYPRDEYGSMGAGETELRTGCGPSATAGLGEHTGHSELHSPMG